MKLSKTKYVTVTGIGIALYVAVSFLLKIPLVNHISLDLGYIILGVYCYLYGGIVGAIVAGVGCTLVSYLSSGFFPTGWLLGNLAIGFICGWFFQTGRSMWLNVLVTIASVFLGILIIKTAVEVPLYGVPLEAKLVSNSVAFITDSITMVIGVLIAPRIKKILK